MKFSMRRSRVLGKLRAGEVAYCFKLNLADARACEIAARHGFDCIWTCAEHVANDWSVIENQILAAKSYDVDILCRVPRGSYSDHIRPLEMDAAGIMVPHVMGVEDAEKVIRMTRFQPLGRRAADGGNADGFYCNIPFEEYIRQANSERFVVFQIEDPEPLDELEAIAALEAMTCCSSVRAISVTQSARPVNTTIQWYVRHGGGSPKLRGSTANSPAYRALRKGNRR